MTGADSSGVCSLSLQVGTSAPIADPSLPPPNNSSWQECQPASWTAAVDTRDYVSGAGQLPVALQATNAAGLPNAPMSETLNVDNDPVSVSLSTPDDPNPTVWVNHAVTVDATPSTGPSGLGGMNCSVNGAAAQTYPAAGLTVDGDGVKTVTCTAWNNAVDPQGNHNSGTSSVSVHIDEAPPVVSLEPVNPNDPTALVADTSDSESGVAGGSIEMAPAGTGSWTSLPTTFTGSQLLAHFNDAGLDGSYSFKVTSCDNVGNCASTTRTVMLPARVSRDLRRQRGDDAHGALQRGAGQEPSRPPSRVRTASQGFSTVLQSGQSLLRVARDETFRSAPTPARRVAFGGERLRNRLRRAVLLGRSRHDPRAVSTALTSRSRRAARTARPELQSLDAGALRPSARVGYGRPVTAARPADEQRRPADRWPAGRDPHRSGQWLERVHPGRSGDHGPGWQLDGDAAARPLADHRGLLPGLADDPARHRVRDRDHPREDRADERHAGSDPVGQHGQDHRAGAGRVHPGEQQAAAA